MSIYSLDDVRVQTPQSGDFWVAPNATVVGNVVIEENASVWFNTVIRGDNETISATQQRAVGIVLGIS